MNIKDILNSNSHPPNLQAPLQNDGRRESGSSGGQHAPPGTSPRPATVGIHPGRVTDGRIAKSSSATQDGPHSTRSLRHAINTTRKIQAGSSSRKGPAGEGSASSGAVRKKRSKHHAQAAVYRKDDNSNRERAPEDHHAMTQQQRPTEQAMPTERPQTKGKQPADQTDIAVTTAGIQNLAATSDPIAPTRVSQASRHAHGSEQGPDTVGPIIPTQSANHGLHEIHREHGLPCEDCDPGYDYNHLLCHLVDKHKLDEELAVKTIHVIFPNKFVPLQWPEQTSDYECPMKDCPSKVRWPTRYRLITHLRNLHHKTLEEARDMTFKKHPRPFFSLHKKNGQLLCHLRACPDPETLHAQKSNLLTHWMSQVHGLRKDAADDMYYEVHSSQGRPDSSGSHFYCPLKLSEVVPCRYHAQWTYRMTDHIASIHGLSREDAEVEADNLQRGPPRMD